MTGDGEVWINEAGYPIRQMLNLTFPEQRGEIVESKIVINFSDFAQPPLHTLTLLQRGDFGMAMQKPCQQFAQCRTIFCLAVNVGRCIAHHSLPKQSQIADGHHAECDCQYAGQVRC